MDSFDRNFKLRLRPLEDIIHNVMLEHFTLLNLELSLGLCCVVNHGPTTVEFTKTRVKVANILVHFGLQHFLESILQGKKSLGCESSALDKTVTNLLPIRFAILIGADRCICRYKTFADANFSSSSILNLPVERPAAVEKMACFVPRLSALASSSMASKSAIC
jgi:hypothetical protein